MTIAKALKNSKKAYLIKTTFKLYLLIVNVVIKVMIMFLMFGKFLK